MTPRNSPLDCGCQASHDSSGEHYIEMCPVHEAADDLLAALKALTASARHSSWAHITNGRCACKDCSMAAAREAIANATT